MQSSSPADKFFLDLSARAKLRLTGTDRVRFLNGQVSNDVRRATENHSIYTGVMTIKGKLCADAFVHVDGESLVVDTEGELAQSLAARLERYIIADDVVLEDVTGQAGLFHLVDWLADTHLAPTVPTALADLGVSLRAVQSARLGRLGLDLFFEVGLDAAIRERLHPEGYHLLNEDACESLRIRAGVPRWGAELDESTLPAEAGIEDRAVSFTKGCYIGQEVVSRVRSVGHVNRQLCGLRATDASPLYAGMKLYPDDAVTGKEVGRITSAASSVGHGGGAFIALGYVRREWLTPGTPLNAVALSDGPGGAAPPPSRVEVCPLPFPTYENVL